MRLFSTFRKDKDDRVASELYRVAVQQAREPAFYADCGVPDTLDGRFEAISLHVFLLLRRLGGEAVEKGPALKLAQSIFDTMFIDMDENLREIGVGDLSVGKKVKQMAQALYGRIAAYEDGLAGDDAELAEAVRRNLYGTLAADGPGPDAAALRAVAAYVRRETESLANLPVSELLAGRFAFGRPPVPGA